MNHPGLAALLLEIFASHQLEAIFVLALTTGMREGEMMGMHWQDIHLERKELQNRGAMKET